MQIDEEQVKWRTELAALREACIDPRYPWDRWLNGETHVLVQGLDFHISVTRLQANVTQTAWRKGLRARTAAHEGVVTIRVIGERH